MSEYDDWSDELGRLAESIAPMPAATALVHEQVRRRQRRRAVVAVLASAAAVAAVAGTGFALSRPSAVAPAGPVAQSSSPTTVETTSPSGPGPQPFLLDDFWEEPKPGDCPELSKVFDPDAAPPIPDLAEQQRIVQEISAQVRNAYQVRFAQATPLGVVALVTGNVDFAKEQLGDAGVSLVYEWDRSGPEVGLDEEGQVGQVLAWQLDPVVRDVRRRVQGISADGGEGDGELALWTNAGAVLLQWKEPVPDDVLALGDLEYAHGVHVVVEGVRYSPSELHRAMRTVMDRARAQGIEANSGSGCGDLSGIVIGVGADDLRGHEDELREEFADWAGIPVTVIAAEPAVGLDGTIDSPGVVPR